MVPHPIVRDLCSPIEMHCPAHNVGQVQVPEGPTAKRLGNLVPKGLNRWRYLVLIPLIVAVRYILQRASVLKDRALLSTQLFVGVVIHLVIEGLYDVGCGRTDISTLSGPLISFN